MAKVTFEDFYIGNKHYDKQVFNFHDRDKWQFEDMIRLIFNNALRMMANNKVDGLDLGFIDTAIRSGKYPKKLIFYAK